jgi:hypothetical protein
LHPTGHLVRRFCERYMACDAGFSETIDYRLHAFGKAIGSGAISRVAHRCGGSGIRVAELHTLRFLPQLTRPWYAH